MSKPSFTLVGFALTAQEWGPFKFYTAEAVHSAYREDPPCGHEGCRTVPIRGEEIARGFSKRRVLAKAKRIIQQELEQESTRRASEALGG